MSSGLGPRMHGLQRVVLAERERGGKHRLATRPAAGKMNVMLRATGLALLLTSSAGCGAVVPKTQRVGQGDNELGQTLYRLEARWSLEVGQMTGFSSLGRDSRGVLWSIPESEPFLVALDLEGEKPGMVEPSLRIIGTPSGWDVESLTWLADGRAALGTETKADGRAEDVVLLARREGDSLRVEDRLILPYRLWHMRARGNNGIEGICSAGRRLVVGVESVLLRDRKRFAPIAVYDFDAQSWSPLAVELTTPTGKLSAVACRLMPGADSARTGEPPQASTLEVLAIERHFDVARIIRFEVRPDRLGASSRSIRPTVLADITTLIDDRPNPEGLELYPDEDRLVVITDNNYGGVTGPTELLVLRRIPQR